jgi:hypothetical protein
MMIASLLQQHQQSQVDTRLQPGQTACRRACMPIDCAYSYVERQAVDVLPIPRLVDGACVDQAHDDSLP